MANERETGAAVNADDEAYRRAMQEILRAVKNVQFGSVEITIHDSKVVQIDRTEKLRLAPPSKTKAG